MTSCFPFDFDEEGFELDSTREASEESNRDQSLFRSSSSSSKAGEGDGRGFREVVLVVLVEDDGGCLVDLLEAEGGGGLVRTERIFFAVEGLRVEDGAASVRDLSGVVEITGFGVVVSLVFVVS